MRSEFATCISFGDCDAYGTIADRTWKAVKIKFPRKGYMVSVWVGCTLVISEAYVSTIQECESLAGETEMERAA